MCERELDVFFYGLNMSREHLEAQGVDPQQQRLAYITGFEVRLGAKAFLVQRDGAIAPGVLFRLRASELDCLYDALPGYAPQPVLAATAEGHRVAALTMLHRQVPDDASEDIEYAARWRAILAKLGFPPSWLTGVAQPWRGHVMTCQGSCHCGAVRFQIASDFPELTQCDCSMCKRKNALMVKVHESSFTLLSGDAHLTEYRFHTGTARHFFCKTCGIYPFHRKRITPEYFGVNVHCLEGFDVTGIPVRLAAGARMV